MNIVKINEETYRKSAEILKRMFDGEPKNINPLKELPEPEMRLYGVYTSYFETEEELKGYCKSENISVEKTFVLDYFRNVAGRSDVIGKTQKNGTSMFYTVIDEDGYGMYNHRRSVYRGEFIWEYNHGSIRDMYVPFRDRGIIFENDVYAKIDERFKRILKKCKEDNLFNCGKK